jgi:hypothetical protein
MSRWIRGCGVSVLVAVGVAGALGSPAGPPGGLSPLAGAPTACPVLLSVSAPGGGVPVPVQLVGVGPYLLMIPWTNLVELAEIAPRVVVARSLGPQAAVALVPPPGCPGP